MKAPDIVYMVKPDDSNEELRYSLRSLKHLPHGQVVMAGYKPTWAKDVIHIERDQSGQTKYQNTRANWIAACNDKRVSADFILFNDDFFVMKPLAELAVFYRGPTKDVIRAYQQRYPSSYYTLGLNNTKELLERRGLSESLCYELHVPMTINKRKYLAMMNDIAELVEELTPVQSRTLYGNYYGIGGEQMDDVKIYSDAQQMPRGIFTSTRDGTFKNGRIGRYIRERFPDPSPYEVEHG